MAQNGQLRLAVEAARGAVIAVHAAGGLARGHVQALRLLRAAEGLCRSAVVVLQDQAPVAPASHATVQVEGSSRRRRPRGKRRKQTGALQEEVSVQLDDSHQMEVDTAGVDAAANAGAPSVTGTPEPCKVPSQPAGFKDEERRATKERAKAVGASEPRQKRQQGAADGLDFEVELAKMRAEHLAMKAMKAHSGGT